MPAISDMVEKYKERVIVLERKISNAGYGGSSDYTSETERETLIEVINDLEAMSGLERTIFPEPFKEGWHGMIGGPN